MIARALFLFAACAWLAACRATPAATSAFQPELETVFDGQHDFSAERLRGVVLADLAQLPATRPSKPAIDDAAFALLLFYRARGHAFVRVDYDFEDVPGEPVRARFTIDEGPEVRVSELRLEGVTAIDSKEARALFGPAATGGVYDADRLADGVSSLRDRYLDQGFLRASTSSPAVEFSADRRDAVVSVSVTQGTRFHVTEIAFEGGGPELTQRQQGSTASRIGDTYTPRIDLELRSFVEEDYARHGYPDCSVEPEPVIDEETGGVRLVLHVDPGARVVIQGVRITGNKRAKDALIRERLGIQRGDVYDSEQLRAAFRGLYATGLFQSIHIATEGTGSERTLLVEVQESRSVDVRLEPGWGSYEGPRARLAVQEKNFRGLGQRVSLQGTASLLAQSARLGLIDPFFFGSHFTAETSLFVEHRVEPAFEFSRFGGNFFLRRKWNEDWTSSFGYEFSPNNVIDDSLQAIDPVDLAKDTNIATLSTSTVLDNRDNLLLPTRGHRARASLEWADDSLGSDLEFLRGQLEFIQLLHLPWETVLATSARTGVIAPTGQTDEIPLPERFFNGGESTVRSFREDELGPKDVSGDPIGGESATTLNLELRRSIAGNLAGALFVDAGNVTERVQDYLHFADFRFGIGVGVRYLLPIGPLRIDFGVNPNPQDGEDDYVLQFSVGFPY